MRLAVTRLAPGACTIAAIQRLAPSEDVARKLLHDNAAKLFKI